ncbi:MAG: metal-dependent hydrolase [Bdellovibrionota bacterium]
MNATAHETKPAPFPVRRMDFDFSGLEKYWYDGQPGMTFFWSLMSALFPDGEQFFIDSVLNVRDRITDPAQQKILSAFIGQEAMHRKEHGAYNRYMTEHFGVDLESIERTNKRALARFKARTSPAEQLALTAAAEHFTAIMAKHFMKDDRFFADIRDERVRKMLYWHAIEESEHKAVVFDVLKSVDDSYRLRAGAMVWATAFLFSAIGILSVRLMRADGQLYNWKSWRHYARTLLGRKGFFTSMLGDYLDYYRPDFHPSDHDTRASERVWKERLSL